jgi:hypothetical protein
VRQGKESAATAPLEVRVIGPEPQDFAKVELLASERSVYPGQRVAMTVAVLLRRLTYQGELLEADPFSGRDPPQVRISWLEGTEILKPAASLGVPPRFSKGSLEQRAQEDGPSFLVNDLFVRTSISLFEPRATQAAVRFDREAVERENQDGERVPYYRYSLPLEYRMAHAGSVGPLTVHLRGPIFTAARRGARGIEADRREIFAVSEPLTLNILPVPKAGQPETFTGGVGVFKIAATALPTEVHVGDPITLTIRISGTGNLEEIGAPKLDVQEKWTNHFKVYDENAPGRFDGNDKVFTLSVRPKAADVEHLPSIRFSYFNPKLKKYEDAYSERIALEVAETERLDTSTIVDAARPNTSRHEIEELTSGLLANYTGPDVLAPQGAYDAKISAWLAIVAVPPIAWFAAYTWYRRKYQLQHNPSWQRARAAYRTASQRLELIANGRSTDGPDAIARTLGGYLADHLGLANGELTPAEALHHAQSLGVETTLAEQLAKLLEHCDLARFALGNGHEQLGDLVQSAQRILQGMERDLSSNKRRRQTYAMSSTKLLLFTIALLQLLARGAAAQEKLRIDRDACLARANAAFERGARSDDSAEAQQAFLESIGEYERLIADGVVNGKLYYNLANANVRIGDLPRAILYYRMAERLLPRDEQIAANLRFARSRIAERVETNDTSRLLRQLLVVHYACSIRERTQVAVITYLVAWVALAARIASHRRWFTFAGLCALAISASMTVSVWAQRQDEIDHPIGVLVADDVIVRKGDGDTYEPQFNRPLGPGLEFRVLNRRDEWMEIELRDGKSGWIRGAQAIIAESNSGRTQSVVSPQS